MKEDLREKMVCNDIAFKYREKEYFIFQGNNSCIVGRYDTDDEDMEFNCYDELMQNIDDTLDNWLVEGKPLREIAEEIEFIW